MPAVESIWRALDDVKDPEIPVVSLVEMGIVRDVTIIDDCVIVTITPTFSGCPALHAMKADIVERLTTLGYANVEIKTTLTPAWSTDWITESARVKLRDFGLAPPPIHRGDLNVMLLEAATCPYCGSTNTSLRNSFGPTACRMIFYCNACNQPFEQFKPL
ncbi:MAG: phenylacetate-CoA oxygenase subunit PaaJ [Chloroflexi bacterium]|nr:phenylacetate-CoA oxygenase subunit PaaJ [Chloroflexota bacterium]